MHTTPWEYGTLQTLELEGSLDVIWLNLSYHSGEKAEAWKTEATSTRFNQWKMKGWYSRLVLSSSPLFFSLWHNHCLIVFKWGLLQYCFIITFKSFVDGLWWIKCMMELRHLIIGKRPREIVCVYWARLVAQDSSLGSLLSSPGCTSWCGAVSPPAHSGRAARVGSGSGSGILVHPGLYLKTKMEWRESRKVTRDEGFPLVHLTVPHPWSGLEWCECQLTYHAGLAASEPPGK